MKKRLLALLLVLCMVATIVPMAAAAETYTDVDSGAWYYDAVQYVSRNGLMNGTGEAMFSPNGYATRAMVMTILARTAGVNTEYGATWYEAGLNWAVAGGVSDGSNPLDNITREQLAAILYRYAKMIGCDMNYWQPLHIFSDAAQVSDWAVEGLEWAVAVGLFEGTDGKLMPKSNATRAQLAAVLQRYCDGVLGLEDAVEEDVVFWPFFHIHKFGEWETNLNGTHSRTCECGKVETEDCDYVNGICSVCDFVKGSAAKIGDTYYPTVQAAIDAVQNNETIVVFPSTYAEVLNVCVGKTFTVRAEEEDTVVIAGINQQTNGEKASTVTFENLTIDNSKAAEGWFTGTAQNIAPCVGAWGGNLNFKNCTFEVAGTSGRETGVMTWWTTDKVTLSFKECTFNGIDDHANARAMQIYGNVDMTVTDCEFNTYKDYTLKYVGDEGCTATLSGNKVYNSENFVELGSSVYPGDKYTVYLNDNTLGENVSNFVIANNENQIVYVDGAQQVSTQEALAAAINRGATTIYLTDGNYYVPACQGKTITIKGGTGAVVDASDNSYGYQTLSGANITFDGVTIKGTDSNFTCKGFQHATVKFNKCTIVNELILNENSEFTDCTFNTTGNIYSIWTWGARTATFTRCTFNTDGKAILLYGGANGTPAGEITTVLTLDTCTFNDTGVLNSMKAAVEVGNGYPNANYKLVANNVTVNGYEINDEGTNTGSTLWGNKNSMGTDTLDVIINGVDVY